MADDDGFPYRALMLLFQVANRFSFLIIPLLVFSVAAVILVRRRSSWRLWSVWIGLLGIVLVYVLISGQTGTSGYDSPDTIRRSLANAGQPTLVEFYSNY